VWREAGWDAAGGVPVGVITLEDVLEELMQVCLKQKLQRHIRFDGRHASHVLCISTKASAVQAGVK
jgi:CBS domain containing-hemolysin-like protein